MRCVVLPAMAQISCRKKAQVMDLDPGDSVQAYDYRNRKVTMTTIVAVNKVESVQKILIPISGWRIITFAKETIALSPQGECTLLDKPRQFIGLCQKDPTRLLLREVEHPLEYELQWEAIELQWEYPEYIWAEGILVGNNKQIS